jgi:hypothetical protein
MSKHPVIIIQVPQSSSASPVEPRFLHSDSYNQAACYTARLFAQVRLTVGFDATSLVLNGYVPWDSLEMVVAQAVGRDR